MLVWVQTLLAATMMVQPGHLRGEAPLTLPSPAPMMAEVGVSISGMPGPPLGPSYLEGWKHSRGSSRFTYRAQGSRFIYKA